MNNLKIFCVGGSIRDTLLGLPVHDHDYVVVESTYTEMIKHGFKPIEATSFPVFHDSKGQEYALARTERKTGKGYHGFETKFEPDVTIEEDLRRRDLTVNSLAVRIQDWEEFTVTKNSKLVIDPFNGMQDLKNGILRHTSDAFSEDPVRLLRVARFAARYNFNVADDTLKLMRDLVVSGELDALTQERVYIELKKTMMGDSPLLFFGILNEVGAAEILFPELLHTEDKLPLIINRTLEYSILLSGDFLDRMIILTASFEPYLIQKMLTRLKAPTEVSKILLMSCTLFKNTVHHLTNINNPEHVMKILNTVNAWKNVKMFNKVMAVFSIFDNNYLPNTSFILLKALKVGNVANFNMLSSEQQETLKCGEISKAITKLRFNLIKDMLNN